MTQKNLSGQQKEFVLPLKFYTDDIDFYGVLHHSKPITYFEHARNDWLLALGFGLSELKESGIMFAVKTLTIEYLMPIRLNDKVEVYATLNRAGRTNLVFEQGIRFQDDHEKQCCQGEVVVVCINDRGKPQRLPKGLLEAMV